MHAREEWYSSITVPTHVHRYVNHILHVKFPTTGTAHGVESHYLHIVYLCFSTIRITSRLVLVSVFQYIWN